MKLYLANDDTHPLGYVLLKVYEGIKIKTYEQLLYNKGRHVRSFCGEDWVRITGVKLKPDTASEVQVIKYNQQFKFKLIGGIFKKGR